MADQSVEPQVAAWLKLAAPYVPGFAGAVLALAFLDKLTPRGRLVAVAVGLAAASFLGPALSVLADLFWPGVLPPQVDSAIKFLTGLLAMGCLPSLLGWARKVAGDPLNLLRIQIGAPAPKGSDVLVGDPSAPGPAASPAPRPHLPSPTGGE